MHIVLAEDEPLSRVFVERVLSKRGMMVRSFENGRLAQSYIATCGENVDLVLTDIMMPEMDGLELLEHIKADFPWVPVIVLTAKDDRHTLKRALQLGAQDFIEKPFSDKALLCAIEKVVHSKVRQVVAESLITSQLVREAQENLMWPACSQDCPYLHIWYKPLTDAGGDFFLCSQLTSSQCRIVLADVAGHNVTGSYLAAEFRGLVLALWDDHPEPAQLLSILNQKLFAVEHPMGHICATVMLWDQQSHMLHIANAGMPHGCLLRPSQTLRTLPIDGLMLGLLDEDLFESMRLCLSPGDRLLFFSDGLEGMYSPEVIQEAWQALRDCTLQDALDCFVERLALEEKQSEDDLLLVAFESPEASDARYTADCTRSLRCSIESDLLAIESAVEKVKVFISLYCDLNEGQTFELTTVLRELLSNAIIHGHRVCSDRKVDIAIDLHEDVIELTVQDEGPGFDLHRTLEEEKGADVSRKGGRGLLAVEALAERIQAQRGAVKAWFKVKDSTKDRRKTR